MIISNLKLLNFRNIEILDFNPISGVNVICGENGQGKTNLLEAIWLFTGESSFRGAKDSELIQIGKNFFSMEMNYFAFNRTNNAKYSRGEKKELILNDSDYSTLTSFSGNFMSLIFSPNHLSMVKGGPNERRQAIDMVIGQVKPKYNHILSEYNKILFQRNSLLKEAYSNKKIINTLDVWDMQLSSYGALLTKTRKSYLDKLAPYAEEIYYGLSGGKEKLSFSYFATCSKSNDITSEEMVQLLNDSREEDIKNGYTSIGPHRDDFDIFLSGNLAKSFGSQGQQRSIVLAFKLGESNLIEEVTGESPVILLDDVLSELDKKRREYLLHHLENKQIFITCCDPKQVTSADSVFVAKEGIISSRRKRKNVSTSGK